MPERRDTVARSITVMLDLPDAAKIVETAGLGESGAVQRFHTQNVLRRIQKYMPYQSGTFVRTTIANTDVNKNEIVSVGPQAAFLYYGKVMVDSETGVAGFLTLDGWKSRKGSTKIPTDRDLQYNQEKNPHAGPFWDRALVANEGALLLRELQDFVDKRGSK